MQYGKPQHMTIADTDYTDLPARMQAALVFANKGAPANIHRFAQIMGFTIHSDTDIASPQPAGPSKAEYDLLFIDLMSELDRPAQHLHHISSYMSSSNANAVVWIDSNGLEEAYAILPVARCHFLIDASDADAMLTMVRAMRRGKMDQLHDGNREIEFRALHRISDELADFARTLARIAEQDDDNDLIGFAEKPISFRPAPASAIHPFMDTISVKPERATAKFIRENIKLRRMRDRHFPPDLFADPAWDILLDLFASRLEGITVSVSSLCIAAAVPATTALRWVTGMTSSGILLRRHDPSDARRVFIELSEETAVAMATYFTEAMRRNERAA
jgi:hypothetical protein